MKYFALCGFGGILSCGITHTAVVPLDLVKCRIQVSIFILNQNFVELITIFNQSLMVERKKDCICHLCFSFVTN